MYNRRDGLPEHVGSIIANTFGCGFCGGIAGGIWAGALGFGFGVGALWGGVGLAVVGVLFGFLVNATGRLREGAFNGGAFIMAPLVGAAIIGGIVWIVRALL
jgi:hypothetical protein